MFDGRKVAFKALFGSHNYNLNTPESDRDYKYFIIPTFEDLYRGKFFSTSKVGQGEDYDVHDIRQLPSLWWKSNINFLEVLFSEEVEVPHTDNIVNVMGGDSELPVYQYTESTTLDYPQLTQIFSMRDKIVRMNLPYLFNACIGMHYNKMKLLEKGTAGTQHLVDKFGWDCKQGLHALRVLDFLIRFHARDFADFKGAITYDESERVAMLMLKRGLISLEGFRGIASAMLADIQYKLTDAYQSQKPDEQTREEVDNLIMELVKSEIGR
jgi:hypothetical protein